MAESIDKIGVATPATEAPIRLHDGVDGYIILSNVAAEHLEDEYKPGEDLQSPIFRLQLTPEKPAKRMFGHTDTSTTTPEKDKGWLPWCVGLAALSASCAIAAHLSRP